MAGKRQPQLVIVEDDLELSEMLGAYFKVQGYKVNTVAWGKKAIEICTSKPPNLILLDIRFSVGHVSFHAWSYSAPQWTRNFRETSGPRCPTGPPQTLRCRS